MAENDGLNADAQDGQTVLGGGPSAGDASQAEPEGSVESKAEGSVTPKWTEQLPSEYREQFAGYESYKDFVKAAAEAIPMKDSAIVKPADDAPSEDWDRFYAAVGRPDGPDGYDIEGEGIDEFKQKAHELGLTAKQAKDLYSWYSDSSAKAAEKQKEEVKAVAEKLKEDWGDSYDANMKAIERFKKAYATPELVAELQNPAVGNNINLIKALAKAGADLQPESLVEGKPVTQEPPAPHFTYAGMSDMYPKKDIKRR